MKKLMLAALGVVLLGGCVGMRDITANDLRKPEHAAQTLYFDKSVQQVNQALFEHATGCRSLGTISADPTGSRIVVTDEGMGLTKLAVWALVDIDADGSGVRLTSYDYYHNKNTRHFIGEVINAISDPKTCS
ncbi:hypothetical protein FVF58_44105 [Paraburkholderia panacisoli]|uniref:Lipoprotein n=1 Tax=Paraburkholderia panacisoli TaxID=2603818 RepID=A0A5B0G5T2_9BURK|nr:hypothetical protein [Paraburkholderia panacisoli]KAA0998582.1 hypothetical protein FVF58_44105 [Paraburkholderia panacisoli]